MNVVVFSSLEIIKIDVIMDTYAVDFKEGLKKTWDWFSAKALV